jgi:hypothetical protein
LLEPERMLEEVQIIYQSLKGIERIRTHKL